MEQIVPWSLYTVHNLLYYMPVTALNQFPTNSSGPPLAAMPPIRQATLHNPTSVPNAAMVNTPTFETSVVASVLS